MKELSSCKIATAECIRQKYFTIAHLYKEVQSMNMHIHDCYEIYYSISGGKQFLIDNKFYSIQPGDIFVINQFESHYLTQINKEIHERLVICVHPEFLKELSSEITNLSYCFIHRDNLFSHKLSLSKSQQNRLLYYINKIICISGYGADLAERAAFIEMMLFLNSSYYTNQKLNKNIESPITSNKQVNDILSYINTHIYEPISIDYLATHFYLSSSYICRLFKSTTGMTINRYINTRRISIAKSLLADGLTVGDVCTRCGYNDYSNFVKTFSKTVGMPPKKYAQICNF